MGEKQKLSRRDFLRIVGASAAGLALAACAPRQESNFIESSGEQEIIDLLWEETKLKREQGTISFPWPEVMSQLNEDQRIREYARKLGEVWQNRIAYWTPYDEFAWQAQNGSSRDFWRENPIEQVSDVAQAIRDRDPRFLTRNLGRVHTTVFGYSAELPSGLADTHERILSEFLSEIGASSQNLNPLSENLGGTVQAVFSLPRFSVLEASIQRPELFPNPHLPVIGSNGS